MDIKAPLDIIKTALEVARFTATSGAPALAGVHVALKDGAAEFTGYNGEQAARTKIAATGTNGEGLLPRPAVEYINALPSGSQLHLSFGSDSVKIVCGKLSATMRTEPPTNYPKIPFSDAPGAELEASTLRNGLREVRAAAAAATSSRPALAGVLFDVADGELRLVTTDSYRLAVSKLVNSPFTDGVRITVPIRAITELERALARTEKVTIRISDVNACFETDTMKLTTHLISDKFPAYGQIMPNASAPVSITASSVETLEAIKRLKIVAPRENRSVKVSAANGGISISTTATSGDTALEPLAAKVNGTVPDFAVNVDYFADAITSLGSENYTIAINDPLKPLLMTRPGDEATKQVMMPIRI